VNAAFSLWVYGLLTNLAKPLLRRKLHRRAQLEPLYGQFIEERFGHYDPDQLRSVNASSNHGQWIWVHAVSLGETRTAGILIQQLRATFPHLKLLLTHGTATGREEGLKYLQPGDLQVWQPWDAADVVHRFFKTFQPRVGLILETEIWPNCIKAAAEFKVPLVLVNARMSEKSMQQAKKWSSLMQPAYAGLTAVLAQSEADASRLKLLGAKVQGIFGNLKFDAQPDPAQMTQGQAWRELVDQPVVMLASSREGEEALWLDAWQTCLQNAAPTNVLGMIVPRHPQRVDEVAALIQAKGFKVIRRSSWGQGPLPLANIDAKTVVLGDSLGEMALYYSLADVAMLGGSFEPLGGQNLIEAAACACPIVMGPHTFNFTEAAASAEKAGAALRTANMLAGVQMSLAMASDTKALAHASEQAQQFARQHGGATQRTVAAVRGFCL
jgi:3-deoxy-D-manno-octulosonic-acid transferase